MEIWQTRFCYYRILEVFWPISNNQINAWRTMWIFKGCFFFNDILTIIDMKEISHGLLKRLWKKNLQEKCNHHFLMKADLNFYQFRKKTFLLIRFLFELCKQHINDFLFLILNSTWNALNLGSIFYRVDGTSSLI